MDADAFIEVTGRLQKKLDAQRLANEWTSEDTLAEKKRLIRQGMNEKEASEKLANEFEENRYMYEDKEDNEYPALTMQWAIDLFKTVAANKTTEETEEDDHPGVDQSVDRLTGRESRRYVPQPSHTL